MVKTFVFLMAMLSFLAVAQATSNHKPLEGRDLKDATEMNDMYARHMYSSTCMERQKSLYTPQTLTPAEQASRMQGFKKSCDCLTDTLLKTLSPNDLIDYVTFMDGTFPPGLKNRPKPTPEAAQKYAQISKLTYEIRTRKQCGFNQ